MIKDKKEVNKQITVDLKNRLSILRTDRSWLFIILLIMVGVNIYTVSVALNAVEASKKTHEVVWVKLSDNGNYKVSNFDPTDEQPLYSNTVNALLKDFIIDRYQYHPETIRRDYAESLTFMSPHLGEEFTSATGFNAAQIAADAESNPNAKDRIDIKNIQLDHYDQITGSFQGKKKPIIRTMISFNEYHTKPGQENRFDHPIKMKIKITWTLLSRDEISKHQSDWLQVNPIGIEILTKQNIGG